MAYTVGDKFLLNDKSYIGTYNEGPDNNYYTGETYTFGISELLTPINKENKKYRIGHPDYDKLKSGFTERDVKYATDYYPQITDEDIQNGFIIRHFAQPWNDENSRIVEIDEDQFNSIDEGYYQKVELKWLISGNIDGVIMSNSRQINEVKDKMINITKKIPNAIEFYNIKNTDII
jgi:hypothetical protein